MAKSLKFDLEGLSHLFPYFLLINRKLQVVACGSEAARDYELNTPASFSKIFSSDQEKGMALRFESMRNQEYQQLRLRPLDLKKSVYEGQFVYLPERDAILLIGRPSGSGHTGANGGGLPADTVSGPSTGPLSGESETGREERQGTALNTIENTDALTEKIRFLEEMALFPIQSQEIRLRMDFEGNAMVSNDMVAQIRIITYKQRDYTVNEFLLEMANQARGEHVQFEIEVQCDGQGTHLSFEPQLQDKYYNIYGRKSTLTNQAIHVDHDPSLSGLNIGLLAVDKHEKILFSNKWAADFFGFENDKSPETTLFECMPESTHEFFRKKYISGTDSGIYQQETKIISKTGKPHILLITHIPFPGVMPNDIVDVYIFTDMNAIYDMTWDLRKSKEFAEKLAQRKEDIWAILSHEIRTPMNSIVGMGQKLMKTRMGPKQEFYLRIILQSSENLLSIINDILDFSKMEAGKIQLEDIPFSAHAVTQRVIESLGQKANDKDITLGFTYSDPTLSPFLTGDPHRLEQVLINIINNAVKFTEKGSISVSCEVAADNEASQTIRFRVKDTGIGMSADFLNKIGSKFMQASESISREYGGSGLGLYITRQLVRMMNGHLSIESKEGEGSTIDITIPFVKTTEKEIQLIKPLVISRNILKSYKILIIDDNEINLMVAADLVAEYGAITMVANNAEHGIMLIDSEHPDLVLMDVQMPGMDGISATKLIRAKGNTIPIIAVTANAMKDDEKSCIKAGMNAYIVKPFTENILIDMIAGLIIADYEKIKNINAEKRLKEIDRKEQGESLFNTEYIQELGHGNPSFVNKILKLFIIQAPMIIKDIDAAFESKDWTKIKRNAHRLKPSIDLLRIKSIQKEIREVEMTNWTQLHQGRLPQLLKKVSDTTLKVVDEIKAMNIE